MYIERKNLMIIAGVVLVLIVAYMYLKKKPEHFGQLVLEQVPIKQEQRDEITSEIRNAPKINPQVGSIIDGPGFESGEVDGVDQSVLTKIPSDYYFLDDGADGKYSITSNLFSKSCCSTQWPTPFHQKYDPYVCQNKGEYVGSNIMGNNTFQDSGCLCLDKNQAQFLYNRGGNGREWF